MRPNRRQFLALTGLVPIILTRPGVAAQTSTFGGYAFGSYWRISGADRVSSDRIRASIESVVEAVDCAMSPYRTDSEIARFNACRSTDWIAVSHETQTVLATALSVARRSAGSFDPTVGPLVQRYGFGPITGTRNGSYQQLSVGAASIRKAEAGLTVDLCGIAKGHALDRMVAALDATGCDGYLIELGGEVFARGRHPSGRRWQVAIDDPRPDSSGFVHLVAIDGLAVATSGNKVNGFDVSGHRYGHIVDPLTSSCVGTSLQSVSVMAERAIVADGLATAMMAMGLERAIQFAERDGVDALLLARDGKRLRSVATGRFAGRMLL